MQALNNSARVRAHTTIVVYANNIINITYLFIADNIDWRYLPLNILNQNATKNRLSVPVIKVNSTSENQERTIMSYGRKMHAYAGVKKIETYN